MNGELVVMQLHNAFEGGSFGIYVAAPPGNESVAIIDVDQYQVAESYNSIDSMTGDEDFDFPDDMTDDLPDESTEEALP